MHHFCFKYRWHLHRKEHTFQVHCFFSSLRKRDPTQTPNISGDLILLIPSTKAVSPMSRKCGKRKCKVVGSNVNNPLPLQCMAVGFRPPLLWESIISFIHFQKCCQIKGPEKLLIFGQWIHWWKSSYSFDNLNRKIILFSDLFSSICGSIKAFSSFAVPAEISFMSWDLLPREIVLK